MHDSDAPQVAFFERLAAMTALRSLTLQDTSSRADSKHRLAAALVSTALRQLQSLTLCGSTLDGHDCATMPVGAITALTALTALRLEWPVHYKRSSEFVRSRTEGLLHCILSLQHLQALDLSGTTLGPAFSARDFCKLVARWPHLSALDLSGCQLKLVQLAADFPSRIAVTPSLLPLASLKQLDLSRNSKEDEISGAAASLRALLTFAPALTRLKLDDEDATC